jgi:hypothetical protein
MSSAAAVTPYAVKNQPWVLIQTCSAVSLPFALPLVISMAASVSGAVGGARYFGTAFAGSSVAGQAPR